MTKSELEQFLKLKNEVIVLENQLASLQDKADENSMLYGLYSLTDDPEAEIRRRTEELRRTKAEYTEQLHKVEAFIDHIRDSRMRTVFRLRYFEGWRWLPIAFQVGYADEQRPRKLHDEYLQRAAG
ncbi:hypothetical protein [Butyricicoccus sp. Marseille-Q5471]|uniref:hypothetical protein n=1 Tax=Butyricicoccus sp. Marseille-Q5471 TaxID=3039493 RepID=UPI0024BD04DA|nr:hypothetical protein [Butyricicoccus sp. Marseille-Q5471]